MCHNTIMTDPVNKQVVRVYPSQVIFYGINYASSKINKAIVVSRNQTYVGFIGKNLTNMR